MGRQVIIKESPGVFKGSTLKWDVRMGKLMNDFFIPYNVQAKIFSTVKESMTGRETDSILYDRAWNLFKKELDKIL